MRDVLEVLLPSILPQGYRLGENVFVRPHQGKSDLKKSIPTKMRALSHYGIPSLLVVLQDQDSHDCRVLKEELTDLCRQHGHCPFLVRIVCRELESWYLGDMDAIGQCYTSFKPDKYRQSAKFRNPDLCNAADELSKLIKGFSKGYAARNIPSHMDVSVNNSESFRQFRDGLQRFLCSQNGSDDYPERVGC